MPTLYGSSCDRSSTIPTRPQIWRNRDMNGRSPTTLTASLPASSLTFTSLCWPAMHCSLLIGWHNYGWRRLSALAKITMALSISRTLMPRRAVRSDRIRATSSSESMTIGFTSNRMRLYWSIPVTRSMICEDLPENSSNLKNVSHKQR